MRGAEFGEWKLRKEPSPHACALPERSQTPGPSARTWPRYPISVQGLAAGPVGASMVLIPAYCGTWPFPGG